MVRKQNESNFVWFIAIFAMFVIVALRCFDTSRIYEPDSTFLYNRACQMLDCLKNGYWPFIYYNDVGGIGYGSPIFYGQLTLLPFLPLVGSMTSFMNAYFLVCVLLNFFGFRFFLKRVSNYATLGACFYILGIPFVSMCTAGMYAFNLGLGFSWFFFAYCIDFFRDSIHFPHIPIFYFLIWQSNFISVFFATVACFCIFITYFNSSRYRDYIKLFCVTLLFILFDITNILAHTDAIRLVDVSGLFFTNPTRQRVLLSTLPIGGFVLRYTVAQFGIGDICCGLMPFGVLFIFIHFIRKHWSVESRYFRVGSCTVFVVLLTGYIFGLRPIWSTIYQTFNPFFQFPIRYLVFVYGFFIACLSRVIIKNKVVCFVLLLCTIDVFIANPFRMVVPDGIDFVFSHIVYGEYAGKTFIDDTEVYDSYSSTIHSESGASYSYVDEYNGLSIDCSTNPEDDILTLPKLYYRWYVATGDSGENFAVKSGYSNYCEVDIGPYTGSLRLRYQVPFAVLILFVLQIVCLVSLSCFAIRDGYIDWRRKRAKAE